MICPPTTNYTIDVDGKYDLSPYVQLYHWCRSKMRSIALLPENHEDRLKTQCYYKQGCGTETTDSIEVALSRTHLAPQAVLSHRCHSSCYSHVTVFVVKTCVWSRLTVETTVTSMLLSPRHVKSVLIIIDHCPQTVLSTLLSHTYTCSCRKITLSV